MDDSEIIKGKKFIGIHIWESDKNGIIPVFPDQIEIHEPHEDKFIDYLLEQLKAKYGEKSVIYYKSQQDSTNNPISK
jgi:hypothetical protein